MGDVGSDREDIRESLLAELKRVRRQGFWEFRARDCPTLAQLCGPPPEGQPPEIPIRARLLDLLDPAQLDEHGRPRPRVELTDRPRADRGLFGRVLFGEPLGTLTFPDGPSGQVLTLAPRSLQLTERYKALARLRGVSDSTINKTPKQREPRGGQAHQLMLDLIELLANGAAPAASVEAHATERPRRRLTARAILAIVLVAVTILGFGGAWAAGVFRGAAHPSGCVLLDVSASTTAARDAYLVAFAQFAREIGTSGSGRLCIIRIAGNPLTQSRPITIDVGPDVHGNRLVEEREVAAKVAAETALVRRDLRTPATGGRGSGVVEAALEAAPKLKPGDIFLILSDGIQTTSTTGDFRTVDLSNPGIDSLLASLEARGFIANLRGVEIRMPLLLYMPGRDGESPQRAVQIRTFWKRWAMRAGGTPTTGF